SLHMRCALHVESTDLDPVPVQRAVRNEIVVVPRLDVYAQYNERSACDVSLIGGRSDDLAVAEHGRARGDDDTRAHSLTSTSSPSSMPTRYSSTASRTTWSIDFSSSSRRSTNFMARSSFQVPGAVTRTFRSMMLNLMLAL